MANYARIINEEAVDVSSNPEEQFHPSIAAGFVQVPDEVGPGWRRDPATGAWSAPTPVDPQPEPAAEAPKVSPVEFKLIFTPLERVAIRLARDDDLVIEDIFAILEDPRLTHVDLGLQSTRDALAYLESQGLITAERRAEILTGVLQ